MELFLLESVLKEVKDNKATYYFFVNDLFQDFDKAGIYEFDLKILEQAEGKKDMVLYLIECILDKKLSITKNCPTPNFIAEDTDIYALSAICYVIEDYFRENKIPETSMRIFNDFLGKLFRSEGVLEMLKDCNIFTDLELDEIRKKYCNIEEK